MTEAPLPRSASGPHMAGPPRLGPSDEYWDELASQWKLDSSHRLWRRHSDCVNALLLKRWIGVRPVNRMLKTDLFDEAVSEGLVPLLKRKAETLVGMDASSRIVESVGERYPQVNVKQADTRHLPFESDWFDTVVSLSTLDHFESQQEIIASLREISRVLRPGGQLLITLDNLANPAVWLRNALPFRWLNRLGLVPYVVGKTCRPGRLQKYVTKTGFKVLETTAVMHCPRVIAVAAARYLQSRTTDSQQKKLIEFLLTFEHLSKWPTCYVTGHFVAIRAIKP